MLLPRFVSVVLGPRTSTTLNHNYSRWFYRNPPTLIRRLPVQPSQADASRGHRPDPFGIIGGNVD